MYPILFEENTSLVGVKLNEMERNLIIPTIPSSIQMKETRDGEAEGKILNTYTPWDNTLQFLFTFPNENLQVQMKHKKQFPI